jgi:hypothetical protein
MWMPKVVVLNSPKEPKHWVYDMVYVLVHVNLPSSSMRTGDHELNNYYYVVCKYDVNFTPIYCHVILSLLINLRIHNWLMFIFDYMSNEK